VTKKLINNKEDKTLKAVPSEPKNEVF